MSINVSSIENSLLNPDTVYLVCHTGSNIYNNFVLTNSSSLVNANEVNIITNITGTITINDYSEYRSHTGAVGVQGFQGDLGLQGFQGYQGSLGNQGVIGVQGNIGLQGIMGVQGNIGLQGVIGVQGNIGLQGDKFIVSYFSTGNDLPSSLNTVNEYAIINYGELYIYKGINGGNTGPDNSYLFAGDISNANLLSGNGSQGNQGNIGLQGFIGVQGFQGITSSTFEKNKILYNDNNTIGVSNLNYSINKIHNDFFKLSVPFKSLGLEMEPTRFTLDLATDNARKLSTTTWLTSSDERVKENIEDADLDICYNIVKNLKLKRFKWKEEFYPNVNDRNCVGFIAQDVEQVFPKAILGDDHELNGHKINGFKSLDSDQIFKTMFGALKKVIDRLENVEGEIVRREIN
jgi:hypothetical protein